MAFDGGAAHTGEEVPLPSENKGLGGLVIAGITVTVLAVVAAAAYGIYRCRKSDDRTVQYAAYDSSGAMDTLAVPTASYAQLEDDGSFGGSVGGYRAPSDGFGSMN